MECMKYCKTYRRIQEKSEHNEVEIMRREQLILVDLQTKGAYSDPEKLIEITKSHYPYRYPLLDYSLTHSSTHAPQHLLTPTITPTHLTQFV